jgi:thiamine pyrophosphokinase
MSRIVIFANGVIADSAAIQARLRSTDRFFCANGGTLHALALGLTPEAIIGDLDSLPPDAVAKMEARGVVVHRHPVNKDKTDLELAFDLALAEGPDEILLLAALGGRLDQTLANLLLLTRPEFASIRVYLVDGPQLMTLLHARQRLIVPGQPGDTLSLVPLTPVVTGVTLTGVEWPLEQATLSLGSTLSISNVLIAGEATVQVAEGLVFVVHLQKQDEPGRPIEDFNH